MQGHSEPTAGAERAGGRHGHPAGHGDMPRSDTDRFAIAGDLIASRRNVSPKRLIEPGPTAEQLHALLSLAAAAPDHGGLTPWRFIAVPVTQRHRLAEVFALALVDRDPSASPAQLEAAREKAYRAPMLLIAVACLGPRVPDIPAPERIISMGAAIQNLLLGAHAMGFGAGLTSGRAMNSPRLHDLCGLGEGDSPVCCVNIGTVSADKPRAGQTRRLPDEFFITLGEAVPGAR